MTREEYKEKCRAVLIEYLTSKGWPKLNREQIRGELPNMYRKLEENNLIMFGLNYQNFIMEFSKAEFLSGFGYF